MENGKHITEKIVLKFLNNYMYKIFMHKYIRQEEGKTLYVCSTVTEKAQR